MKNFLFLCALIVASASACKTTSFQHKPLNTSEHEQFLEAWNSLRMNCFERGNLILSGSVFWNKGSSAFEAIFEKENDSDLFRMAFVTPFGNTVSEIVLRSGSVSLECNGKCPEQELEIFEGVSAQDMRALVCGGPALLSEERKNTSNAMTGPEKKAELAGSHLSLELMPGSQGSAQTVHLETQSYFVGRKPITDTYFSLGFLEDSKEVENLTIQSRVTFGWIFTKELSFEWHGCKRNGKILPSRLSVFTKTQKSEIFLNEFELIQPELSTPSNSSGQNCNISE